MLTPRPTTPAKPTTKPNIEPGTEAHRSASQWVIECPNCHHTAPALERGIIRIRAASIGKRTLARCTKCHRLVLAKLYKDQPKPP